MPQLPDNRQVNVTGPGKPPPPQIVPQKRAHPHPAGTTQRTLTHVQFYQLCEAMRGMKTQLLAERPNAKDTAALLSSTTGIDVSYASVADLKEATGITWSGRQPKRPGVASGGNRVKVLIRCVRNLYLLYGAEVPPGLQELYDQIDSNKEGGDSNG